MSRKNLNGGGPRHRKFFKSFTENWVRSVTVTALVLINVVLLNWDMVSHSFIHEQNNPPVDRKESTYQRVIKHSYLVLKAHPDIPTPQVVTVTLSSDRLSGFTYADNACESRKMLSTLIPTLYDEGFSVIVLDLTFGPNACSDPIANDQFTTAFASSRIPIIVARSTRSPQNIYDGKPLELLSTFPLPGLDDTPVSDRRPPKSTYGISRFTHNLEAIPTEWLVRTSTSEQPRVMDGLAFAAVRAADPDLSSHPHLRRLSEQGHETMLDISQYRLPNVGVTDVLCNEPSPEKLRQLHDKTLFYCPGSRRLSARQVAVIGNDVERDRHPLSNEQRAGFEIHAEYVEALLSAHYFEEIPGSISLTILLLWSVGAFVLSLRVRYPTSVLIVAGSALVLLLVAMCALILGNYYPPVEELTALILNLLVILFAEFLKKSAEPQTPGDSLRLGGSDEACRRDINKRSKPLGSADGLR
jgi:hypothetical protein